MWWLIVGQWFGDYDFFSEEIIGFSESTIVVMERKTTGMWWLIVGQYFGDYDFFSEEMIG